MLNKEKFENIAKSILRSKRGLKSPQIMHPNRDWPIGLFVAVVIFIASAAWSAQMYLKYQNTSISNNDSTEAGSVVYRESLVTAALQEFSMRKETHRKLLGAPKESQVEVKEETASSTDSVIQNESASSTDSVTDDTETSLQTESGGQADPSQSESEGETAVDIQPAAN